MKLLALTAAVAAVSSATPTKSSSQSYTSGSPCAAVSASVAASPSATVDAKLAYDCLNSVPLHKNEALKLMDAILPYADWQSDPTYLKNPPSGYLEPGTDINADLEKVIANLKSNVYANEYSFQTDLFATFNKAKDGHYRYFADLMSGVFKFNRNVALVSVSLDGKEIPQVYLHADIEAYVAGSLKKPSPLKSINGQSAIPFLLEWSQKGAFQDPDALWNVLFYTKPLAVEFPDWPGYFGGGARFAYIYPGEETVIALKNGTSFTAHSSASVIADFSGVTDGESAYQKFCVPMSTDGVAATVTATATSTSSTTVAATGQPAPGYPIPEIISSDNQISGYFLNDSDVAVLSMISFSPDVPAEFQAVTEQFLNDAKAAGMKKLVIDVSGNGGGYILQGYDSFRQLFPHIVQEGYTRYRYTEALAVMAEQYSVLLSNFSADTASADEINAYESFANYKYDLDVNNKHFHDLDSKIGPVQFNGDNYTHIMRWDLDDPLTTTNATFGMGFTMSGYGDRKNLTQPFAAEDIIILYDGYCASTCTLFSEFMRVQAGVKSIAMGGRPQSGPIQGIGGVKGANDDEYDYLNYLAQIAYQSGTPEQQVQSNWTSLSDLTLLPTERSTNSALNVRDNILDLKTGVPAQFIYEAADCRLYYEPKMIADVTKTWEAAADAAWGSKQCASGSLAGYKKNSLVKVAQTPKKAPGVSRLAKGSFTKAQHAPYWENRMGKKLNPEYV